MKYGIWRGDDPTLPGTKAGRNHYSSIVSSLKYVGKFIHVQTRHLRKAEVGKPFVKTVCTLPAGTYSSTASMLRALVWSNND